MQEPISFSEIKLFPQTFTSKNSSVDAHESVLRSFQILERVKVMLKRNDSNETILDVINELEDGGNNHHFILKEKIND